MARKPEPTGPKPPLVGLVKLQVNWTGPGTPTPIAANILHGRWADNLNHGAAALSTVVNGLQAAIVAHIIPLVATTWFNISNVAQSLGGDGLLAVNTTSTGGSTASTVLPANCTVASTWSSTATWRGGRPRTYWPGVPASNLTSGYDAALIPAAITGWTSGASTFMTAMNALTDGGVSFVLGFPSYYSKYAFRPVPLFFPFLGVRTHGRIDSQRRRLGKERYFA